MILLNREGGSAISAMFIILMGIRRATPDVVLALRMPFSLDDMLTV